MKGERTMIGNAIIDAFSQTAKLTRESLNLPATLMPLTVQEDARTAAPGWIGSNWKGGTLMVGINPGGGGDAYRRNPTDDRLYALLRAVREAGSKEQQRDALMAASKAWISIQRTHNIWRIIEAILSATGEDVEQVAFMNIMPFRTRMDKEPPVVAMAAAWKLSAGPQVNALAPRRIIALGAKAYKALSRFSMDASAELIQFKRGIGDSYIPPESQIVLTQLRAARTKAA
jgi:hypothetical protein